jgi:uncharacterized protein
VNAVFADTSFFLALLNKRDPLHERALAESKINRALLTTEFVLLELGNACSRSEDHADFLALLAAMRASSRTTIVPLDSRLLQAGLDLFARRADKDWSLTDCISFAVMEEKKLRDVLTADHHFQQAGFHTFLG